MPARSFALHLSSPQLYSERTESVAQTIKHIAKSSFLPLSRRKLAAMLPNTPSALTRCSSLHSLEPYSPPAFAAKLPHPPTKRFALGILPTPIHPWKGLEEIISPPCTASPSPSAASPSPSAATVDLFIKRDDLSGVELSGNKVRKLEFLVADALEKGADALLSIGGIQSNHARAVAAAARAAGLECHLILRTRKGETGQDPGFAGNLLIERLLGAHIHLVSKEEYAAAGDGGFPLLQELGARLRTDGNIKSPYLIPLGGSNALGAWGYLEASREIIEQAPEAIRRGKEEEEKRRRRGGGEETAAVVAFATGSAGTAAGLALGGDGGDGQFDVVAFATGSAGTAAGLALGLHLAGSRTLARAYCVCDDPRYFYDEIQKHVDELCGGGHGDGLPPPPCARDIISVVQARGSGYAISRPEELRFLRSVASSSGVLLDPVYTGKAAKAFFEEIAASGAEAKGGESDSKGGEYFDWRGKKVLFLHTGGIFGLYGAAEEVAASSGMVGVGVEAFRKSA